MQQGQRRKVPEDRAQEVKKFYDLVAANPGATIGNIAKQLGIPRTKVHCLLMTTESMEGLLISEGENGQLFTMAQDG